MEGTTAGVSAGLDLALALVEEDHGPDLARDVARELVLLMQRPGGQSQFSIRTGVPAARTPVIRTILDQILLESASDHRAGVLARRANMSERHLRRLFNSELGITPSNFVEQVRLERARTFLQAGSSVSGAAAGSGLGSDETLRRVFAGTYGTTPSEYRRRFAAGPECRSADDLVLPLFRRSDARPDGGIPAASGRRFSKPWPRVLMWSSAVY